MTGHRPRYRLQFSVGALLLLVALIALLIVVGKIVLPEIYEIGRQSTRRRHP